MDELRKYAALLCIAAAAAIVAKNLVPSEKFEKILRFLIGVFMLFMVISPLKSLGEELLDIEIPEISYENYESISESSSKLFESKIKEKLTSELENIGVIAQNIEINANFNEEGVIILDGFSIIIDTSYKNRADEIRALSLKLIGTEPEISFI